MVDLEAWMYREDGSVGFGISWETIKIKWLWGLRNTFIESLELVPFEWNTMSSINIRPLSYKKNDGDFRRAPRQNIPDFV